MWRAALVGLVACGGGSAPKSVDSFVDSPETFDIDIVVDQSQVRVYLVGVDRRPCTQLDDRFPALGTCVANTDYNDCQTSNAEPCVHRDVTLLTADQTRDAGDYVTGQTTSFSFDAVAHPEAEIVITGCGGQASIPLGSGPLATPTVSAQRDAGGTITATWNGAGATHALLNFGTGLDSYSCLTTDSPYVFTSPNGIPSEAFLNLATWSFGDPATIATALGTARVWRGGIAEAPIAP